MYIKKNNTSNFCLPKGVRYPTYQGEKSCSALPKISTNFVCNKFKILLLLAHLQTTKYLITTRSITLKLNTFLQVLFEGKVMLTCKNCNSLAKLLLLDNNYCSYFILFFFFVLLFCRPSSSQLDCRAKIKYFGWFLCEQTLLK